VCVGIVDTIPPRSNVLLTEVLRLHLATAPMAEHGWIAALQDQVLAPAMASCTPRRSGSGPSLNWRAPWPFPARCSTNASAMCWAVHRSDTSPNGACTSPTTFSAPPNSASAPSRDASGMSPRRRSVAPSGEARAARPAPGELHSSAPVTPRQQSVIRSAAQRSSGRRSPARPPVRGSSTSLAERGRRSAADIRGRSHHLDAARWRLVALGATAPTRPPAPAQCGMT